MKRLCILATAALSAVALVAAIGSASASATVLCKTNSVPCPSGDVLPAGSWASFGGGGLSLRNANGTRILECGGFGLGSQTTQENSQSLLANGKNILWSCVNGSKGGCKTYSASDTSNKVYFLLNSRWVAIGSTTEPLTISFECENVNFPGIWSRCEFRSKNSSSFNMVVSQPEPGYFEGQVSGAAFERTGGYICPGEAEVKLYINAPEADMSYISRT